MLASTLTSQQEELRNIFAKTLNRHGYGFQNSVLKQVQSLCVENHLPFIFEASEFPVAIQGNNTKIDFILSRNNKFDVNTPLFILGECKRANPALSNWCFVRSPFTSRNHSLQDESIFETIEYIQELVDVRANKIRQERERIFHIGFEVKSNLKGDENSSKGFLDESVTQVLRGMNGFINYLKINPSVLKENAINAIVPVIFTTANLWVSGVNLSSANLEDGNIDLAESEFKSINWLLYQHNQSPNIKYECDSMEKIWRRTISRELPLATELSDVLLTDYARTVAIVNSAGVESFLRWCVDLNF